MYSDFTSQKKVDPQVVQAAIESLKAKGWDINPYTVADEVKTSRSSLYRSTELMALIFKAGGDVIGSPLANIAPQEQPERLLELDQKVQQLELQITELKNLNETLSISEADAWRSGYQAAINELKRQIELKKADGITHSGEPLTESAQSDTLNNNGTRGIDSAEQIDNGPSSFIDEDWQQANSYTVSSDDNSAYETSSESAEPIGKDLRALKTQTLTEDELRDLLKIRFGRQIDEPAPEKPEEESEKRSPTTKFVGANRPNQEGLPRGFILRTVPPDIRKACLVLGLRPEDISQEKVHKAWKDTMTKEHPDQGGDNEIAVYINTAKDVLYRWLDAQAPKLGKQFGSATMQFKRQEESSPGPDDENNQ